MKLVKKILFIVILVTPFLLNALTALSEGNVKKKETFDIKVTDAECLTYVHDEDAGRINISFDGSRLNYHIEKKDTHFTAFKAILLDACRGKKTKPVNFTYDERTQKISAIQFTEK
jgi:hypothetical protein